MNLPESKRTTLSILPISEIGLIGRLTLFFWSLAMVMLAPLTRIPLAAGLCLGAAFAVYPRAIGRLLRIRWLVLCALLALPAVFWMGELDLAIGALRFSSQGLSLARQIVLRMMVVLVAIEGLTASVDITSIANLLERAGLRGLGFSVGVALNLLPALRKASVTTWRSLKMRGGLRRQRCHSIQLLLTTILTNALRWAEEVALAAEARAFSPARCRVVPVKRGSLDRWVLAACLLSFFALLLTP